MKYLPTSRIGFFVGPHETCGLVVSDPLRLSGRNGIVASCPRVPGKPPKSHCLPFHELQRASSVIVVYRCLPRSPKPRYLSHRPPIHHRDFSHPAWVRRQAPVLQPAVSRATSACLSPHSLEYFNSQPSHVPLRTCSSRSSAFSYAV